MVRVKNRYLLVKILYPELEKGQTKQNVPDMIAFNQPTTDDLTAQALVKGIRAAVKELFGDFGSGAVAESLAVKYLSPATSTFILRVSRGHYRIAWAALSLMTSLPVKNGKNCVFRVVRCSGTIVHAQNEAIRKAREDILRAKMGQGDNNSVLEGILGKSQAATTKDADIMEVDQSDGGEEDEDFSDDDG